MAKLDKIPQIIWDKAEKEGFLREDVKAAAKLDRSRDNTPCDCYVLLKETELLFIFGINVLKKKRKKVPGGIPLEVEYKSLSCEKLDIFGWRDFEVEQQISGCIICAKNDFGGVFVTRFSNSVSDEAKDLCFEINVSLGCANEDGRRKKEEPARCPKCGKVYPDQNRKICPKCIDRAGVPKRIWFFTKKYKFSVFAILLAMVLASALTILAPYISSGFFYDSVLTVGGEFYGQVLLVIGILVATRILSLLVNMVNEVVTAIVVPKIIYDLKKVLFTSIERLSISFFTNRQTGSLMNQVNGDANTIYWFFVEGLPFIIINGVQTIAIAIIMFMVNWQLTIISIIAAPLVVVLTKLLMGHMNKLHAKNYSNNRSLNGMLTDALNGVRVVKAFSREDEEKRRFEKRNKALAESDQSVAINNTTWFRMVAYLFTIASTVVLGAGGWMVIEGHMTYGTLITFTAYSAMLYSPLTSFVNMISWMSNASNAMQRLMEVMDAEPEVKEKTDATSLEKLRGDIEFKNVEFSYDKNRKIIDGISFKINAGETIGIVGHTGAGKSTVANLLIRLYDAGEGSITIDGYDVRDLTFETLRRNIAIVSQETYLFQGTIFDNIAYAKPEATKEEVLLAARVSGAHDFICKLEDGYSTRIGWGYKDLSGGEKQRISIARALLRDPSILILDEATSAMDTRTERAIQAALEKLSEGRTTIMIAHRLSTLRGADKLMVLENGKIPEEGTHAKLIREKGIYYKLYMLQYEALKNAGIEE
ncbi:MAG: ATP-binding cassette domain-containing protein [Clostridia bacterium]|nr:ATP-binding cassette domain-containing protein [Clostridia bacterium]